MLRPLLHGDKGSIALEFCLISPFLIALFIGIFDMGFLLFQQMQVEAAAGAGAFYVAAKGPGAFDATKTANVVAAAAYPTQTAIVGNASWTCGCPNGTSGVTNVGGTPPNCGGSCANGFTPGVYVRVTANAIPTPIFRWPGYPGQVKSGVVLRIK